MSTLELTLKSIKAGLVASVHPLVDKVGNYVRGDETLLG